MSADLHPSVERFSAAVEDLIIEQAAKKKRRDNLRWVVKDLQAAAERREFPDWGRESLHELMTPLGWLVYEELARAGLTRSRHRAPAGVHVPASMSSMRTRATAWNAVAQQLGLEFRVKLPPKPTAKLPVADRQRAVMRRELSKPAGSPMREDARIRMLAMYGVILDTRARSGELVKMTLSSLGEDLATVSVVRQPQGVGEPRVPVVETIRTSEFTRTALRQWLEVRAEKVRSVEGAKDALWVSLRDNHTGVSRGQLFVPSGMPLQIRGLERAYSRVVARLNDQMPGREAGWSPLPGTVEQLRRSVRKIDVVSLNLAA
ncbi:hypothetical protein ACFVIM_30905 [Streptomyces sp. NPDC057638]|uniref:hypothetical protein n=1 Tax=Streptomyces sp. NPDC057638 TaxID=3346190 RepID=UPI0036C3F0AE